MPFSLHPRVWYMQDLLCRVLGANQAQELHNNPMHGDQAS